MNVHELVLTIRGDRGQETPLVVLNVIPGEVARCIHGVELLEPCAHCKALCESIYGVEVEPCDG